MFVGCGDTNTSQDDQIKQVYYTYVAYAEEKGETPMSYEDWPASIKGDKGDKGDTGANGVDGVTPNIEISTDGYWVINGVETEYKAIGKVGANGTDGEDGANGKSVYELYLRCYTLLFRRKRE